MTRVNESPLFVLTVNLHLNQLFHGPQDVLYLVFKLILALCKLYCYANFRSFYMFWFKSFWELFLPYDVNLDGIMKISKNAS